MTVAGEEGARLAAARKSVGLTQAQAARRLGVSKVAISSWERGIYSPEESRMVDIAALYHTSPAVLRYGERGKGGDGPVAAARTELPPAVAKAARQLVDAFKREMALGGATSEELHYIETVLMTPNLPPTLAGGHVAPDRLLEHIQGLMDPIRSLLRDAGRQV